jgi:20S proteasome subunit alpha 6
MIILASLLLALHPMHEYLGMASKILLNTRLTQSSNFMRQQAMSSKMVFNRPVPVNRLVTAIASSQFYSSEL